jgi:hypothetical protein
MRFIIFFFFVLNFVLAESRIEIKGLRVYSYAGETIPPIIVRFDTLFTGEPNVENDYIVIEFDVKADFLPRLGIRFYHCDRNWRRTENIFIEDIFHNRTLYLNYVIAPKGIRGYNYHFKNIFPDMDRVIQFEYSGNYIFEIYDVDADTIVYATGRFIVVDNITTVNAWIIKTLLGEEADYRNYVNQIDIEVRIPDSIDGAFVTAVDIYENWKIFYPYRIDLRDGNRYTYVSGYPARTRLFRIWNIYPGNEYRQIDLRDYDLYPNGYPVVPVDGVDIVRRSFSSEGFDLNGGCEVIDEGIYAEYLEVTFQLKLGIKVDGEIFIAGAFNNWKPTLDDMLEYDVESDIYFVKKWLKRGIYDYQYVIGRYDPVRREVIVEDWIGLEGNDWSTVNVYYIVVYYWDKRFGGFDRIVGFARVEG